MNNKKVIIAACIFIFILLVFMFTGGNDSIVEQTDDKKMLDVPAELLSDNVSTVKQSDDTQEESEALALEKISQLQATISSPSSFQTVIIQQRNVNELDLFKAIQAGTPTQRLETLTKPNS